MFQPGQSGNPKGRPKGTKNKVSEDFLKDLHALWESQGPAILQATAEKSPETIVKVCASLVPKEFQITRPLEGLSDDELAAGIEYLRGRLAESLAVGGGGQGGAEPAQGLPTLQ